MKTPPDPAGSAAQSDTPNLDLLIERASWYPPLDRDAVLREVGTLRAASRAELGNLETHYKTAQANWDLCLDEVERLRAENARLREALSELLKIRSGRTVKAARAALNDRGEG